MRYLILRKLNNVTIEDYRECKLGSTKWWNIMNLIKK